MPGLRARVNSVLQGKSDPSNAGGSLAQLQAQQDDVSRTVARVLQGFQQSLDYYGRALRNAEQALEEFRVEDSDGRLLGQVGEWTTADGELRRGGQFVELYVGDSVGDRDAADAPLYATEDGEVIIGKGGRVNVRDQYDGMAAWLGAKFDTLPVTDAVDNGSGLVRLEVTAHTLVTGDGVLVEEIGGVPNARGEWIVTKIDADHVDLQGSVFDGAYTSGGTITRLMHITGAANNGAGLIRLTVTAHTYESGDRVSILGVGGVPNATGQWIIKVIAANTFDLVGSTFAGAYTSGGTCVRYFGGGLFGTLAIGESFSNYKLRAFANGDLRIKNALISLTGAHGTIVLDPDGPSITIDANGVVTELSNRAVDGVPAGLTVTIAGDPDVLPVANVRTVVGAGAFWVANRYANRILDYFQDTASGEATLTLYNSDQSAFIYFGPGDLMQLRGTPLTSDGSAQFDSLTLTNALVLGSGGTGAQDAAGARTNLGVYSKSEVYTKAQTDAAIAAAIAAKADHGVYGVSGGGGGSVTI